MPQIDWFGWFSTSKLTLLSSFHILNTFNIRILSGSIWKQIMNTPKVAAKRWRTLLYLSSLALLLFPNLEGQVTPQTSAEKKALVEILAGHEVSFESASGKGKEIRAEFLMKLISSAKLNPPGNKVAIRGAIITDEHKYEHGDARSSLTIPFEVTISDSTFEETFSCISCHFQRGIHLVDDKFLMGVDLNGSEINGDVDFGGILQKLPDEERAANLRNLRIDGRLGLWGASVEGFFDVSNLKARSLGIFVVFRLDKLIVPRAEILDAEVDLSSVQKSDYPVDFDFRNVTIKSLDLELPIRTRVLDLSSSSVGELSIGTDPTTKSRNSLIDSLNLENTTVKGNIVARKVRITSFIAPHLAVDDRIVFTGVDVDGSANLQAATFNSMSWESTMFPKEIELGDIAFHSLRVVKGASVSSTDSRKGPYASKDATLAFLEQATFSQSAFVAYESELKARGMADASDEVFFVMREQRRKIDQMSGNWFRVLVDLMQQYVLGYGRSATAPVLWSISLVVFGFFAFHKSANMEAKVEQPAIFSGVWYSLELFLPIVDLGVAKDWRPKSTPKWRVVYARIHQLAGWVLVPVALGALTGIVK